ncbi:MAG TPA: hypothetical protein VGG48_19405 [Rhizomicrobium sp.]|jgi:predicted transcriptional regulator
MSNEKIEAFFDRIRKWPDDWQDEVIAVLSKLEHDFENPYELTEEEERDLDEGLAEADRGEFVPEEEIEAFFAQFRR